MDAVDLGDLTLLNALANPVRRRLYELVAAAPEPVGRDEAAASIGISRKLAAYHLDKLVGHGLLEASFARKEGRLGRPAKRYRRAHDEFALRAPPRDYRLLGDLLVRAAGADESGAVRESLERVAYDYGRELAETADRSILTVLRGRGYEPFVEERGTIRLRNCPFAAAASRDPELICALNLRLLEGLVEGLGADADVLLEPTADQCCVAIVSDGGSASRPRGS
jgi:predicted ArsR family transcriptional regulator